MIEVCRASDRHRSLRAKVERWNTFDPHPRTSELTTGFDLLVMLGEVLLPPGALVPGLARQTAEIVTYVYRGGLAFEDSLGEKGVIRAGEFQRITPGRGRGRRNRNASTADWAHLFQIELLPPAPGPLPVHERQRFSTAERRGRLCPIASPDARSALLTIHQDMRLYSALLYPGQHVVHELGQGRRAWVHVVVGDINLNGLALHAGDGAGFTSERAISLTSTADVEVLVFDFAAA